MLTPDVRFHPVIWPRKRDLEERFRRCFLDLLLGAKRLSASFHETLLSWRRSGFSVDASQRVGVGEEARLERLARYATRVALAVGAVRQRSDGRIEVETPPDPRTGTRRKVLGRLDFVHAVCRQIPDARLHQIRYYGAYANQKRRALRAAFEAGKNGGEVSSEGVARVSSSSPVPPGSAYAARRSSWARMLRKVFEVEPLTCPRCRNVEMEIVVWITKAEVIDRILKHRRERGLVSPFESRAPPAA